MDNSTSSTDNQPVIVAAIIGVLAIVSRLVIGETDLSLTGMVVSTILGFLALLPVVSSFETERIIIRGGFYYKTDGVVLFSAIQIAYGYFGVVFFIIPHNFGLAG